MSSDSEKTAEIPKTKSALLDKYKDIDSEKDKAYERLKNKE